MAVGLGYKTEEFTFILLYRQLKLGSFLVEERVED